MAGEIREARTPDRPRSRKALHHLEVHPAKNGGHTIKHVFELKVKGGDGYPVGPTPEPEEHVFGADQGHEAIEHIKKHAKIKDEEPDEEPAGADEAEEDEEPGSEEEA